MKVEVTPTAQRLLISFAVAVGFMVLGVAWVFLTTGFGGLFFIKENLRATQVVWFLIGFPISYTLYKAWRDRR